MAAYYFIVAALGFAICGSSLAKFSCRNEKGEPVPWFIGYKLPKDTDFSIKPPKPLFGIHQGVQTMFMDKDNTRRFAMSDKHVTVSKGHHLAETVAQFFGDMPKEHFSMMYNDELPPDGKNSTTKFAHAKGMLLFDDEQGFWLIHSIPQFTATDRYQYPAGPAAIYGQSFICITFPTSQLQEIGKQLSFMEPYVYSSSLSSSLANQYPAIDKARQPLMNKEEPFVREATLTSVDGTSYRHFAKSSAYGKDIYSDEHGIAKSLDRQIEVQSWRKEDQMWKTGTDLWPACDDWDHMTLDIERWLKFNAKNTNGNGVSLKWRAYNDNSKWMLTLGREEKNYICIGDIDRQEEEFSRGGGMMCVDNADLRFPYGRSSLDQNTCT